MISALNGKSEGTSPFDVVGLARNAVDQFVGDEEQFDDITMMCIRYNGQQTY